MQGVASKISADSHVRHAAGIRDYATLRAALIRGSIANISGIVHSCPHLGYLNYICNAYRGNRRHGIRSRRRRRRDLSSSHMRDVGVVVVVAIHVRAFTYRA